MVSTPDVRLIRIAERQHSVFTRVQALRCGLTPDEVRGRMRRGLWEGVHRSVYRMRGSASTFESNALAAVLAAGPGAVASHDSAARLWQLEGRWREQLHVTVPARKRIVVPGVAVHQPRSSIEA